MSVTWDREFRTVCYSLDDCTRTVDAWLCRYPTGHHPPSVYKIMKVGPNNEISEPELRGYVVCIEYWTTNPHERRELD